MNVIDYLFGVQPGRPEIQIVALPERLPAETGPTLDEPFHPSPIDIAYDLAYAAAREGEPARSPWGAPIAIKDAHFRGTQDGGRAYLADPGAWVAPAEMDRMEVAPAGPIGDRDMYRPGCVS